ncbi:MAG: peptide deformylase [Candidatus Omnitrophota bacterium]
MTSLPLQIRIYGDNCLRSASEPLGAFGPSEKILAETMLKTMYAAEGIGLAAPQVGINRRLLVVDVGEGPLVVADPEITASSGKGVMEEGCLSVPGAQVHVERAEKITLVFLNIDNERVEITCDGLLARALQHEIDHLNGRLIVDYAADKEAEQVRAMFPQAYQEEHS